MPTNKKNYKRKQIKKNYFTLYQYNLHKIKSNMSKKTLHLTKLWQGWHNIGQDRPHSHYDPLGSTEKQMRTTGTNIKNHEARN